MRRRDEETVKQAAPTFGPVPELMVLQAHTPALVGRVSAPRDLLMGETLLMGRREPGFYSPDTVPIPDTLPLGLPIMSRSQVEIRFQHGYYELDPIESAKLPMFVVANESASHVKLQSCLALEPGARLWLGREIELLLGIQGDSSVLPSVLGPESAPKQLGSAAAMRLIARAVGVQPPVVERLLGAHASRLLTGQVALMSAEGQARAICHAVQDSICAALSEADHDIQAVARVRDIPRTTFVRLMDRLGIPRAATLGEERIAAALRTFHGDYRLAAAELRVSAAALKRRVASEA